MRRWRSILWLVLCLGSSPVFGLNPFDSGFSTSMVELEPKRVSAETFRIHLGLAREALTRKEIRDFLNEVFKDLLNSTAATTQAVSETPVVRELLETQLLLFLRENPEAADLMQSYFGAIKKLEQIPAAERNAAWREQRQILTDESKTRVLEIMKDPNVREVFRLLNDPLEPYWAETLDGSPSFEKIEMIATHDYEFEGRVVPAGNLAQAMVDFVLSARFELEANFYDFDLPELADAFIAQSKKGLKVRVGIDKKVIETYEEVRLLYEKMKAAGVGVVAVDATGLNHQKMIAADSRYVDYARVLFSSANATISDSDPRGDLRELPAEKRPKESIPNANHLLIIKSQLISMVLTHQLEKTLNPRFLLRGVEFPLSGSFRFRGPIDPVTAKSKEIILAFTPGGGLRSINKLLISRLIKEGSGPLHMAQFAFSSNTVGEALVERIAADLARSFDPQIFVVGETPFAMQKWSQLLKLSGLRLVEYADGKKEFVDDPDAPIRKVLSPEKLKVFQEAIKVAPGIYSQAFHKIDGAQYQTTAKLHHKVLISGIASILGTSFNFSTGAESNSEQILVIVDSELAALGRSMVEALWKMGKHSVATEARLRNERGGHDGTIDPEVDEPSRIRSERLKQCEMALVV